MNGTMKALDISNESSDSPCEHYDHDGGFWILLPIRTFSDSGSYNFVNRRRTVGPPPPFLRKSINFELSKLHYTTNIAPI